VNKTKFLELVKNPDLIEEQDLVKLDELISEHPYSQIFHVLKVKGQKVFNKPDFNNALNLAATYIYDRNILKSILEGPQAATYSAGVVSENFTESDDPAIDEISSFDWIQEDDQDDIFVDEIPEPVSPQEDAITELPGEKDEAKTDFVTTDPLEPEIEAGSIHAELMKNLHQLKESRQQFNKQPQKDDVPENREEQIEIIDNFIKNSLVLSKPNLSAESEGISQADLSEESAKLNEDLVTENLARIYLKQGKNKDAVKIYKKLIGKFPEKKAYFAGKIQKIKKK